MIATEWGWQRAGALKLILQWRIASNGTFCFREVSSAWVINGYAAEVTRYPISGTQSTGSYTVTGSARAAAAADSKVLVKKSAPIKLLD